jgi:hypothetical protein
VDFAPELLISIRSAWEFEAWRTRASNAIRWKTERKLQKSRNCASQLIISAAMTDKKI